MVKENGQYMKMISVPLHFAFCVNDAYARYISVTIKSIIENHHSCVVHIHILTDYISNSNRRKLHDVVRDLCAVSLHIYELDATELQGLKTGHWTIYTWYRILIPNILPNLIKKVIYLDADTLVVSDLSNVFSIDMDGKSIAAVEDIYSNNKEIYNRLGYDSSKRYICAGVMLMNLDYWRKNNITEKIIDEAHIHCEKIIFPDQDSINSICHDTKIILPLRFGILGAFFEIKNFYQQYNSQLRDCLLSPGIIHYANRPPWIKERATHPMQSEWEKYNKMLRHPVQQFYESKGILKLKMFFWDLLHPDGRLPITMEEIKKRLDIYDT